MTFWPTVTSSGQRLLNADVPAKTNIEGHFFFPTTQKKSPQIVFTWSMGMPQLFAQSKKKTEVHLLVFEHEPFSHG